MGEIGQRLYRFVLLIRDWAMGTHYNIFVASSLPGTWIWAKPPVGPQAWEKRLPHAVLSTVETDSFDSRLTT